MEHQASADRVYVSVNVQDAIPQYQDPTRTRLAARPRASSAKLQQVGPLKTAQELSTSKHKAIRLGQVLFFQTAALVARASIHAQPRKKNPSPGEHTHRPRPSTPLARKTRDEDEPPPKDDTHERRERKKGGVERTAEWQALWRQSAVALCHAVEGTGRRGRKTSSDLGGGDLGIEGVGTRCPGDVRIRNERKVQRATQETVPGRQVAFV
ncbi:hypothetical protein JHW43_007311 [Diplocarpon mali]|nr:hypothetical protein JHW43_007311 [Diplocarpon mali]